MPIVSLSRRNFNSAGAAPGSATFDGLSRVAWEGGPSYYSQFSAVSNTEWTTPEFFPIMYWGAYVDGEYRIVQDAALGINCFGEIYAPTAAAAGWMRDNGIWNLAYNLGPDGSEHVGWAYADEVDMWAGYGTGQWTGLYGFQSGICTPDGSQCGQDVYITQNSQLSPTDGRMRYANIGKGAMMWRYDDAGPAFVNGEGWPVSLVTGDLYFYTDWNLYGGTSGEPGEGEVWLGLPDESEVRKAANYGEIAMARIRNLDAADGQRKPVGILVELGAQNSAAPGVYGYGLMNPDFVEGATWSCLIHEARMIGYFSHAFGEQPTADALNHPPGNAHYDAVKTRVGAINAKVTSLAPVLNTQSYVHTFNASVSTMFKQGPDGYAYVFAMLTRAAAPGSFTFTLPVSMTASSVEVVGEGRTLSTTGSTFADSFAAEYTHHVYKFLPVATGIPNPPGGGGGGGGGAQTWVNRTVAVSDRSASPGSTRTITFPAASAGNLLVAVVGAGVTTSWPGGWTERLEPVNNTELSVATKTATAGETSVTVTHNAAGYPAFVAVYEFPAGSTWVAGAGAANTGTTAAQPTVTGLPGTAVTVFYALIGAKGAAQTSTAGGAAFASPVTEEYDGHTVFSTTDGFWAALGYENNVTDTSRTNTVTVGVGGTAIFGPTLERVTFAIDPA